MIPAIPVEVNELFILQAVFHSGLVLKVIALLLPLLGNYGGVTHALMSAVILAGQAWTSQIHIEREH